MRETLRQPLRATFSIIALMISSPSLAEDLVPFVFQELPPPQSTTPSQHPICRFQDLTLPQDFSVFATGGYSGKKLSFQIDQSGHQATQFDVAVNYTQKPVILMLGSYEPTIWNIGWSEGTRIIAVVASGYHRQVLAGLPSHVPQLVSTYDNKGACGYFYINPDARNPINPKSRQLFGRPVDMVFPAKNGNAVVGNPLESKTKLITSKTKPPQSYYDNSAPLAGPGGLKHAVEQGYLRRATPADGEAWVDALASANPAPDVPPVAGIGLPKPPKPSISDAFVVLKPFTYPAGLYGGHSATFFIPVGIPVPSGDPGHSAVYDFNTLRCLGALCGQ